MDENTRKLLEDLAQTLGTTVDQLKQVLIRQAYISLWSDIVWYVIWLALAALAYKLGKVIFNAAKKDDFESWMSQEAKFCLSVFICCLAASLTVISFTAIEGTITKIVNPEYWALEQVLEALKR